MQDSSAVFAQHAMAPDQLTHFRIRFVHAGGDDEWHSCRWLKGQIYRLGNETTANLPELSLLAMLLAG